MSFKTKFVALALAAIAATGSVASTVTPAEAHGFHPGWGWGVGAGLVGAAVVGSAIAASDPYPYYGYRHCGWVRQFDAYGNYVGAVRSCYLPTAITSALSAPATDLKFSLIVDPASDTGASSTPCRTPTRPAVPRAGHLLGEPIYRLT